jgi:cytoskeletal protein CcmA (bactofilin family)
VKKLLRHRSLVSRGHVNLDGPVRVSGRTVVGGDLTVHGDLECMGPLLCLGHVDVRGNLKCGDALVAGRGVEVAGSLQGGSVRVWEGFEDEEGFEPVAAAILGHMPKRPTGDDEWFWDWQYLADDDVMQDLIMFTHPRGLDVEGDCVCGRVNSAGHVDVGGLFRADDVDAFGYTIGASELVVEGDADCGFLFARREVTVEGNLECVQVECLRLQVWGRIDSEQSVTVTGTDRREAAEDEHRIDSMGIYFAECGHDPMEKVTPEQLRASLECRAIKAGSISAAGSIRVTGSIDCGGYLKANRSIIAGEAITTGKKHGVLAGIGVPRDRWLTTGYVCTPHKPARILTGVYRSLGRRRSTVLKPAGLPRAGS